MIHLTRGVIIEDYTRSNIVFVQGEIILCEVVYGLVFAPSTFVSNSESNLEKSISSSIVTNMTDVENLCNGNDFTYLQAKLVSMRMCIKQVTLLFSRHEFVSVLLNF